jgi:hypothetical protein
VIAKSAIFRRKSPKSVVKAVAALVPIHEAQVLTYMKLAACPAGLLINFNVARLVDGVKRLINPSAG